MSQPSFPSINPEITRENSFNMLLSSIAMEELGLSHIINAEGEKLQYVLGTLPGHCGSSATVEEVLEVNKSVSRLLETVMQNQIFLKSKMDRVLDAMGYDAPLSPRPRPEPPQQPPQAPVLLTFSTPVRYLWEACSALPWQVPCGASSKAEEILLPAGKKLFISFSINVLIPETERGSVSIEIQTIRNGSAETIFPYRMPFHLCAGSQFTAAVSNLPIETDCGCETYLRFLLTSPECINTMEGYLTIAEQ